MAVLLSKGGSMENVNTFLSSTKYKWYIKKYQKFIKNNILAYTSFHKSDVYTTDKISKLCGRSRYMRDLLSKCSATLPTAAGRAELLVNKPSQWTQQISESKN